MMNPFKRHFTRRAPLLAAAVAILLPHFAAAQEPAPVKAPLPNVPFTVWLGPEDYPGFHPEGQDAKKMELSLLDLDGPGGRTKGFRFTTNEVSSVAYGEQATCVVPRDVAVGDVLLARFQVRTVKSLVESGECDVTFIIEGGATFQKSMAFNVKVANQWKEFSLPFVVKEDMKAGKGRVAFRLGTLRQTVEVAELEIRNYHHDTTVAALPMTRPDLTYAGMEPEAPWRAEAAARIAKIRRSPLTVQVVDAAGRPVPNARVEIRQTRHAYGFGSMFDAEWMFGKPDNIPGRTPSTPAARALYQDTIARNFNMVTIGNAWKWVRWINDQNLPVQASKWAKDHDLMLRGHNMVWPGWRKLPVKLLKPLANKPDEMRTATLHHVEEVALAAAPYVTCWDVINETYDNHDLMDICGEHILVDIFETAKRVDPKAQLFINDYNILGNNGLDHGHQDAYEKVIKYLLDQHAPLEGIGEQGHFGHQFTPPVRLLNILDRFAKFKLPIQITEFDLDGEDAEANARYMRDVMTVVFSHPATTAFVFWGSFDGVDVVNKPEAMIFDKQGQFTTFGKAWHQLVFEQWWTTENATTLANGTCAVPAYHGNYEVSVSRGANQTPVKATAELKPGGSTVKIVLPP